MFTFIRFHSNMKSFMGLKISFFSKPFQNKIAIIAVCRYLFVEIFAKEDTQKQQPEKVKTFSYT